MFGLFRSGILAAAVAALLVAALPLRSVAEDAGRAKYVFLMIGDGMGAAQRAAAQEYRKKTTGEGLVMESLPFGGLTVTDSVSGVTDSAAAGTALACGVKTKNGALGVDADGKPVDSLAADAKKKGMRVAIITDVPINHATPAAFYAHCGSRGGYSEITGFLPGSEFDILAGDKFLVSKGGSAPDSMLADAGYKILDDIAAFARLEKGASKVVFFMTIPYAIQETGKRRATLAQVLEKTISLLDSDKGFFIMLEGGRIDWACHNNDIAAAVKETLAFDDAVGAARDFYLKNKSDTLIVVTADHETGALETVTRPSFASAFDSQKGTKEQLVGVLADLKKEKASFEKVAGHMRKFFGLGELSSEETASARHAHDTYMGEKAGDSRPEEIKKMYGDRNPVIHVFSKMLDKRAGVKWGSNNHSGARVKTTAVGVGAEMFGRDMDNTEIPANIRKVMGPR